MKEPWAWNEAISVICAFGNFLNPLSQKCKGKLRDQTQQKRCDAWLLGSLCTTQHEGVCSLVTGCSRVGCRQEGLRGHRDQPSLWTVP